jgi:methyltransferase (TIGR00027 family)
LDLLEIIAFKEEVLRESGAIPACERSVLAVDLLQDWTSHMTEAGFDSTETTAWLAEGLLRYLTADDVARLLGSPVRSPSQDALFPGPRWRGC